MGAREAMSSENLYSRVVHGSTPGPPNLCPGNGVFLNYAATA